MIKLVNMVNIVPRNFNEEIISLLNNEQVPLTLGRYSRGTATDVMLDYLGVAEKEKCISFSILPLEKAIKINAILRKKIRDSFSFAIPITSVGGKKVMEQFEKCAISMNETDTTSKKTTNYQFDKELILVVINRGFVENVMEIARKAGAPGGTVIHARGTGYGEAEKFFGVTIGAEKEIIFIVTKREKRDEIMKAIMENAGTNSPAGSMLFSLPVTTFDQVL